VSSHFLFLFSSSLILLHLFVEHGVNGESRRRNNIFLILYNVSKGSIMKYCLSYCAKLRVLKMDWSEVIQLKSSDYMLDWIIDYGLPWVT
jgi:hypothetical protein